MLPVTLETDIARIRTSGEVLMGPYPGDNDGQLRLRTHNGTGMKRLTDAGEAPSDVNPDIRTSRDSLITSSIPLPEPHLARLASSSPSTVDCTDTRSTTWERPYDL